MSEQRRWRLRLKCRPRRATDFHRSSNLFARLSPRVARALFDDARAASTKEGSSPTGCWRAYDAVIILDCDSGVEFLPLEIVLSNGTKVYASYNGGSVADDGIIELPSCALPGIFDGDCVDVVALVSVRDSKQITVEPMSERDWELMELYADILENGDLLRQVSVIYPGQILELNVGIHDYVQVRVDPDLGGCRRLVADTQVSVIPKPRSQVMSSSQPLRLVGTSDDWSATMISLAHQLEIPLLDVPPGTVVINPATSAEVFPHGDKSYCQRAVVWRAESPVKNDTVVVVKVDVSDAVPRDMAALNILSRYSLSVTPLFHKVHIQLIAENVLLEAVQRTRDCLDRGNLFIDLPSVHLVIDDDKPSRPWRLAGVSGGFSGANGMPKEARSFEHEIFLTEGSVFSFLADSMSSLYKVCFRTAAVDRSKCEASGSSPFPWFVLPSEYLPLIEFSPAENYPHICGDANLTLMPPTPHYPRPDCQASVRHLAGRWTNDAWVVCADTGTGKTHFALVLAAIARMRWSVPSFYLDCRMLQSSPDVRMNDLLLEVSDTLREAVSSSPSLVILDDLDHLIPSDGDELGLDEGSNRQQVNPVDIDQSLLLASHFRSLLEQCQSKVTFVITCRSRNSLAPEALEAFTCTEIIRLGSLSAVDRVAILSSMFSMSESTSLYNAVSLTEGYRPADLEVIARRVLRLCPGSAEHLDSVLQTVLREYVPLSRQGLQSEVSDNSIQWKDIGGIFDAKKKLKSIILDPVKYRRLYEKAPTRLPRGILLFGPPGCGKSLLAPALAKECGHTLVTCRGPELLDRYIGASEANVRRLFERAVAAAPCILFLDEFDALAPRRGTDHTGVTDRVVNQLLTYLDGVESTLNNVFVIAATSRPDKVDPALLRPGRLEQHIYVGYPESFEELKDALIKIMTKRRISTDLLDFVLATSEVDGPLQLLRGFSPADIKAVMDTAQLESIHHCLSQESLTYNVTVQEDHFLKALQETRPSVSPDDRALFDRLHHPFLTSTRRSYSKAAAPDSQELRTSLR